MKMALPDLLALLQVAPRNAALQIVSA